MGCQAMCTVGPLWLVQETAWRGSAELEMRHRIDVEVARAKGELETALRTEQDKLAEALRLVYVGGATLFLSL